MWACLPWFKIFARILASVTLSQLPSFTSVGKMSAEFLPSPQGEIRLHFRLRLLHDMAIINLALWESYLFS